MNKRILVIDDDQVTIRLIRNTLESRGYTVVSAADGEEGIEAVKNHTFDLIILDIQMPRMNGYTFIMEIKKLDPAARNVPVLVLTAKQGMSDLFKLEGAREYLIKPLDPASLLIAVEKHT